MLSVMGVCIFLEVETHGKRGAYRFAMVATRHWSLTRLDLLQATETEEDQSATADDILS
jgi:hypothetical protein